MASANGHIEKWSDQFFSPVLSTAKFPAEFNVSGGLTSMGGSNVLFWCSTGVVGDGSFANEVEGEVGLTYRGCTNGLYNFTTPGQPSGTITTSLLHFALVYSDEANEEVGLLMKPASSSPFAEFHCPVGNCVITGDLIARLTDPDFYYGMQSFNFRTEQGARQVEGSGPGHSLDLSIAGGSPVDMRIEGEYEATFGAGKAELWPYPGTGEVIYPIVTIHPPSGINAHEAALHTEINGEGYPTFYQFQYGETKSYGSELPVPRKRVQGNGIVPLIYQLKGLSADTTYHYRMVAEGAYGTKYGPDQELRTEAEPETSFISHTPTYAPEGEQQIQFKSSKPNSTFRCSLKSEPPDPNDFGTSPCESPFSLPKVDRDAWHTFTVVATDEHGNVESTPASWTFKTAIYPPAPPTSKLVYPEAGKKTASYYTLKAEWGSAPAGGGVTGVTFQMELAQWKAFQDVPADCAVDGKGKPVSWPLPVSSNPGHTEPVFLKTIGCTPLAGVKYPDEAVKFRAIFDGGRNAAGASEAVATELLHQFNLSSIATDATESIGPVTLDLLTGAFTMSRTDVSIPVPGSEANLGFTRVYDSTIENNLPGYTDVLGGWWQPSTPVESKYQGEAWQRLVEQVIPARPEVKEKECWDEEGETTACGADCTPEFCEEWVAEEAQPEERWMELLDNEGAGIPFEISGGSYISPVYAKELTLARQDAEHIVLSDPNGTHTIFTKDGWQDYLPKEVSFQATRTQCGWSTNSRNMKVACGW